MRRGGTFKRGGEQSRGRERGGEKERRENDSGEMGILESLCQVGKQGNNKRKTVFYRMSTGRSDEKSPVEKWWRSYVLQWPVSSFIPAEALLLSINLSPTPTCNNRCSNSNIIGIKLQFTSESRAHRKFLTGR